MRSPSPILVTLGTSFTNIAGLFQGEMGGVIRDCDDGLRKNRGSPSGPSFVSSAYAMRAKNGTEFQQ